MPIKKNTNKLSQLYRTIDQKELSKEALDTLAKLRLATANFRKQEGKEVDAFKLFFDRLIKNKPTAVKTTLEYKAMIKERRSANGRKAMEARKAKQESRQGQGSEEDSKRPAKPFGWRLRGKHNYRKPTRADISSGKAYYEARINRADTNRTKFPMLERGGMMAKGGAIKVINISDDDKLNYFIKKQNRNSGDDSYINDMMTLDYKGKKFYSLGYDTQSGGQVFPLEEAQNNAELVLKIFRGEYDVLIKEVGGNFPDKDFVKKTYVVMTSPLFPNYMLREMKYSLKYADGGFMADGKELKQGDKVVILGTEYTFVKYETNTSQGYDEERVVLKSQDGIGSYPKDMVEAYSKYKMADGGFMADGGKISPYKTFVEEYPDQKIYVRVKFAGGDKDVQHYTANEENEKKAISFAKRLAEKNNGTYEGFKTYTYADGGFMAKGGAIKNQYEDRGFEDIWNNLTRVQRLHFLVDHEDDLKLRLDGMSLKDYYEKRDAVIKLEFSKLNKNIQDEFIHHVYSGQYADGGFMAKGGEVEKYNLSFNYNPSNLSNDNAEKIVEAYTKDYKHNNDFDEVSFYVMGLSKEKSDMLHKELKMEDVYNIEVDKSRYADGGFMAKGGEVYVVLNEGNGKIINKLFNDWNNVKTEKEYKKWVEEVRSTKFGTYGTITYDEVLRNFDFDNAPINSYHLKTFKAELKNALDKGYQYADGGFMADGGDVDKGGMIYALREFVSAGEIANKTDVLNYDDIAKIRRIAIQYYMDNGDVPYSYGELAKVLSYANDKFKSGIMAKGGVFYTDSHKQGH